MMANEGEVDVRSRSIFDLLIYKSMFGGGHATSLVKVGKPRQLCQEF